MFLQPITLSGAINVAPFLLLSIYTEMNGKQLCGARCFIDLRMVSARAHQQSRPTELP